MVIDGTMVPLKQMLNKRHYKRILVDTLIDI